MENQAPIQTPPSNSAPTPPLVKTKSPLSGKLFLAVVILLIFFFGGSGFLILNSRLNPQPPLAKIVPTSAPTPTPTDPTANWKTYEDSTLGASFKYPLNWEINSGQYGISTPTMKDDWHIYLYASNYGDPTCRGDCPVFYVEVSVHKNDQYLSLENYIKNDFKSETGGTGDFLDVKLEDTALINGLSFIKVTGFPGSNFYSLYAMHNKRVYLISVGAGVNGMQDEITSNEVIKNLLIFNQILSTFKFTDQNITPVACTEEAKICPDGSAVGRTGPKCEFAPCPGE